MPMMTLAAAVISAMLYAQWPKRLLLGVMEKDTVLALCMADCWGENTAGLYDTPGTTENPADCVAEAVTATGSGVLMCATPGVLVTVIGVLVDFLPAGRGGAAEAVRVAAAFLAAATTPDAALPPRAPPAGSGGAFCGSGNDDGTYVLSTST